MDEVIDQNKQSFGELSTQSQSFRRNHQSMSQTLSEELESHLDHLTKFADDLAISHTDNKHHWNERLTNDRCKFIEEVNNFKTKMEIVILKEEDLDAELLERMN